MEDVLQDRPHMERPVGGREEGSEADLDYVAWAAGVFVHQDDSNDDLEGLEQAGVAANDHQASRCVEFGGWGVRVGLMPVLDRAPRLPIATPALG